MNAGDAARIRVLIVDDIPETRENLKKLLYFEPDIEVVGAAASGDEAVQLSRQLQPDIVLMDINMPGMDGITAGQMITHEVPQAQIVMMSVQGEADYLRRSMLAGAREFLIKPFSTDELVSTIRRVYQLGTEQRRRIAQTAMLDTHVVAAVSTGQVTSAGQGKVIALFSSKGGVGCSTIAANLAVAIKNTFPDSTVVLVDANVQFGGIDVLLNLQGSRTIVDLAEKADDLDPDFINSVLTSHASGIKVLLAPPRPELGDMVGTEQMTLILQELKRYYDFVIIDMRSVLLDLELTIFDQADRIILIATPDIPAVKNVKLCFDILNTLEYPEEKMMLLINQADVRGAIRPEDIEGSLRHPVAATLPDDERLVTTAINQGVPFALTHRNSPLAQSVVEFAGLLVRDLQSPTDQAPASSEGPPRGASGLLGRLFK